MTLDDLKSKLKHVPTSIAFADVIKLIGELYHYAPTEFSNGPAVVNKAGSNEGSCKIFAFAKLQGFSEQETLDCFGDFYRKDVLQHPSGDDHANIRSFMEYGWAGIQFEQAALVAK